MSRIGKQPITDPERRRRHDRRQPRHREGPEGHARARRARDDHDRPRGRRARRHAARRRAREPRAARAHPLAGRQHGHRRVRGLRQGARDRRRRLPRRGRRARRARARSSASRTRCTSTRPTASTFEVPAPDPHHRARASTSSSSARSPPTSARSASPSRTRARASATPTSASCARPASRRSSEDTEQRCTTDRWHGSAVTAGSARRSGAPPRVRASRCSVRTSTSTRRSIDDVSGRTLAAASTDREAASSGADRRPSTRRRRSASSSASAPRAPGVDTVVFDRGGFRYHGRVAGVADGAREAGLDALRRGRGHSHGRRPVRRASHRHQPGRQGRQGRPAVLVHRARRRR